MAAPPLPGPLQIVELFRALTDASLPNVLVAAGIVFLAIAIAGPAWLDTGEAGRKFGLLFGTVLLVVGLGLHIGGYAGGGGTLDGPATDTPTASVPTAAPTATDEPATATVTLDSFSYPAGYDRAGFTDPDRALDQHLRAVTRQSVHATLFYRRAGETFEFEIVADPESGRVHKVERRDGTPVAELFYDSGTSHLNPESGGFDEAVSFATATYVEGQFDRFFYSTLSDPQAHRMHGRPVVSYFVTSTRDDHEGELTVTEDGLVVAYDLRIEADGEQAFVEYRVTDLGETSVSVPPWVTR